MASFALGDNLADNGSWPLVSENMEFELGSVTATAVYGFKLVRQFLSLGRQ